MNQRMKKMLIALAIVFGGIIAFNLIKSLIMGYFLSHYEPPAVTVSSVTAKRRSWEPIIHAVGNFVAINGVDVNSQAVGRVVALHFDSGQYVEKDTPLIDIDDRVDQATLKSNQSELALQEINYKRQTDLAKRGATPSSSVDEARARLLQAQADVEKTEAMISQKHITAPFSGQLGIRQINLGQYITAGNTAIVSLQSMDPLYLEFYLPEQLVKQLSLQQAITFSVEQNPNVLFEGKISAINSRIDPNTHNIQVQATLPNCPTLAINKPSKYPTLVTIKKQPLEQKPILVCHSDANEKNNIDQFNFIPGMFAAIEITQPVLPNRIVLPTTAISYSLYGNSVYLIEKNKEGKKDKDKHDILVVRRVFIATGEQEGNYTVITKGVKSGDIVVNSGDLKLQDGTRVLINNEVQLADVTNPDDLGE